MYGIHYAPYPIETGNRIISRQGKALSYDIVWPIYKAVADELGLYFPEEYGYAYPLDKPDLDRFKRFSEHIVLAPDYQVTVGNLHYSLFVTMSSYMSSDRSLPLADRLIARQQLIRERAITYFTETTDVNTCEMISDAWVVQDI